MYIYHTCIRNRPNATAATGLKCKKEDDDGEEEGVTSVDRFFQPLVDQFAELSEKDQVASPSLLRGSLRKMTCGSTHVCALHSLIVCVFLMPQTHAHTHKQTHTHTHTQVHSQTHIHACIRSHTNTHTNTQTNTQTHKHTHTHAHANTHKHTLHT